MLSALLIFRAGPLTPEFADIMKKTTWRAGCPVPLRDLQSLKVAYWDFGGKVREGDLIINYAVAPEVEEIFRELHAHKFPIESIRPVETYGGSDDLSMAANNTSAFNCREKTGQPGTFSNHSWGRAIDINPLTNPFVRGTTVAPPGGRDYLDRKKQYRGGIEADGFVVQLFKKHGWNWGGDWKDRKDYQHFEKPAR